MRQDKRERIIYICMLFATLILIALVASGCGSGGGGALPPGASGEGVTITCMDAQTDPQAACGGVLEGIQEPGVAIYNAGDIRTGSYILALAEVTNFMAVNAPVYFYTEFNEGGVFSGSTAQTYRSEIMPGETVSTEYGSNPCPDQGACVHEGYWEYVTYIYNASHMPVSILGDPAIDEVLFKGTIKFTLRSGL